MDGRELRYSKRLKLIRRAEHFGIRRFDANLIIAMVQNRVAGLRFRFQLDEHEPDRTSRLTAIAVFVVVQSLIVAVGWWILR